MNPAQGRPRLDEISSLRFFAAAYIFLFHAYAMQVLTRLPIPNWFSSFCQRGYIAVSFFFVLSGFVLVYGYADRVTDWTRFMRARLARVYPAYLLGLLFNAGFFFAINLFSSPDFQWFVHHQPLIIFSQVTLTQAWFPRAAVSWNIPGWAVSVFFAYYAAFPWVSRKFSGMSNRKSLLMVALAWMASLGVAVLYVVTSPDGVRHADASQLLLFWLNFVKFNPVVRFSEFLMGVLVGYAVLRHTPNTSRATLALLAGIAYIGVLLFVARWLPYIVMHTGLAAPGFALIVYGMSNPPRWTAWLRSRPLTMLGDASLSFYLLHATIIGVGFLYGPNGPQVAVTWTRLIVVFAIATTISLALHRWWETPARKLFDGRREPKPLAAGQQVATA